MNPRGKESSVDSFIIDDIDYRVSSMMNESTSFIITDKRLRQCYRIRRVFKGFQVLGRKHRLAAQYYLPMV